MNILFAASEQESFVSSGSVTLSTSSTRHNPTYTRGAMVVQHGSITADFAPSSEVWVHMLAYLTIANSNVRTVINVSDVVRVHCPNPASLNFEYFNGSTWVSIDTGVLTQAVLQDIDLHVNLDASAGNFTLYQNGVEVASFTGDTTQAATTVSSLSLQGSNLSYYSQILVKTTSTLGGTVQTLAAEGDGSNTDFTGTYVDIDEIVLNDDGDAIYGTADGQVETFIMGDVTIPVDNVVEGMTIGSRMSIGSSGPQNVQFVTRSNSVDYPSGNVSGVDLSLRPYQVIIPEDPDTSSAWTESGLNAVQIGLKAIT